MFNRSFFIGAGERALKTFCQTLISVLILQSAPLDVLHAPLVGDLSLALGATLLSVLTSLAGASPAVPPASAPAPDPVPAAAKHAADPAPPGPVLALVPPLPASLVGDLHGA